MIINRRLKKEIINSFFKGKGIILLGPRQVGKTTLMQQIIDDQNLKFIWYNADEPDTRFMLNNVGTSQLKAFLGDATFIIIDEAQRIPNIGILAKMIIESFPEKQLFISGSSSFELQTGINEPLTGRKFEFKMFPISFEEMVNHTHLHQEIQHLETRLLFGSYPEIITNPANSKRLLNLLTDSYIFKDLFTYEGIKKPNILIKLLQLLALQIGSEVSFQELANNVGIDKNTVEKYIDLLEKAFVVFRLSSLSRNVRNEIKKGKKIYFYDTGIRNALIGNFQSLELRMDKEALWENFLIAERLKFRAYNDLYGHIYFWRTTQQQEIDYLEEFDGGIHAYEFKWKPSGKQNLTRTFKENYHVKSFTEINQTNYFEFLMSKI